jgi:hypothetical protein
MHGEADELGECERAFDEAIMLGSGNATIVQASSWSCLTPPHLEPKRYPLQNVSNLSGGGGGGGLEKVTVNLLQMSPTLQQRGNT